MRPLITNLLDNNSWLLSLPEEARSELLSVASFRRVGAGHVLFRQGDSCADLYGLLSGRIKIGAITYSGNELVINTKLPGDWFGEIAILDGKERTHGAEAVELSELVIIPKAAITQLNTKNRAIHDALIALICRHCRQAFSAIDDFLILTPEQRLASRLVNLNLIENKAQPIKLKLNQHELSCLIGVSRQSISKILKKWEQNKFISRGYNSIEVLSIDKIQALIDQVGE